MAIGGWEERALSKVTRVSQLEMACSDSVTLIPAALYVAMPMYNVYGRLAVKVRM